VVARQQAQQRRSTVCRGSDGLSVAAHLIILLAAVSIFLPGLSGVLVAQQPHQLETGIFGDRIVICTGSGLKVIRLDENGDADPSDEDTYNIAPGLCAPLATLALAAFRDDLFVQLRRPCAPDLPCPTVEVFSSYTADHPPSPPRGPPVFS